MRRSEPDGTRYLQPLRHAGNSDRPGRCGVARLPRHLHPTRMEVAGLGHQRSSHSFGRRPQACQAHASREVGLSHGRVSESPSSAGIAPVQRCAADPVRQAVPASGAQGKIAEPALEGRVTVEDRFWSKVWKGPDCWLWLAAYGREGYGLFQIGVKSNRMIVASRQSWIMAYGPIPEGMLVCHHCDNPQCVRPDHLFLGTRADNNADMVRKGRQVRGERHASTRLTDDQVRAIRTSPETARVVAAQFNTSLRSVRDIRQGRTWRHLLDAD
jgi:hypothetical protein